MQVHVCRDKCVPNNVSNFILHVSLTLVSLTLLYFFGSLAWRINTLLKIWSDESKTTYMKTDGRHLNIFWFLSNGCFSAEFVMIKLKAGAGCSMLG
jgi:hypothetical protein